MSDRCLVAIRGYGRSRLAQGKLMKRGAFITLLGGAAAS
jgi:hypothetical protein